MAAQRSILAGLLVMLLLAPVPILAQPVAPSIPAAVPTSSSSILIVENAGQWPAAARFQVWGSPLGAGTTWLGKDAIWLVVSRQVDWEPSRRDKEEINKEESRRCGDPLVYLSTCLPVTSSVALKLSFPGSNPAVRIEPFEPLTTTVSYFIGGDPAQWRSEVPVWGGVRYGDLYPGVDLVLGGRDGGWRLDAAPGAAVEQVRVQVEGAGVVALDGWTLHLEGEDAPITAMLPSASFAYQVAGLSRHGEPLRLTTLPGRQSARSTLPAGDPTGPLYSTFLGGVQGDRSYAVAVDGSGSAFVTGSTESSDFPVTPGAFDPSYASGDAFVAKLNSTGSRLIYATFLGGSGSDSGFAIAVNAAGNAYVAGTTYSTDFPVSSGAFDSTLAGSSDSFVTKLNPTGSALAYGTYLGGSADEGSTGIAVDGTGCAVVTGSTRSSDFPATPGVFDPTFNGGDVDAFVAQFNPTGSALSYATFLGGSNWDFANAVAVDETSHAYVTGRTYSGDFPTTSGAFDVSYDRYYDVFVVKLYPAGSGLAYATFLGGSSDDEGWGIAVDRSGHVFVAGWTGSRGFPTTPAAFNPIHSGSYDVFVTKLDPNGRALVYSTFLGGRRNDHAYALALDSAGSAYVTGATVSEDFPTTADAFDRTYGGGSCWPPPFTTLCVDAFIARLSKDGSVLLYSSYLGGSGDGGYDQGKGIAVGVPGRPVVAGMTSSNDFPTTPGAFDPSHNGGLCSGIPCNDAFVTMMPMRSRCWLPLAVRDGAVK